MNSDLNNVLIRMMNIRQHFELLEEIRFQVIYENSLNTIFDEIFNNILDIIDNDIFDENIKLTITEFGNICKTYYIKDKDDTECSICMELFKDNVSILPCNHYFHTICIKKWLCNQSIKCPICRKETK